jgi:fatty acid desaturase
MSKKDTNGASSTPISPSNIYSRISREKKLYLKSLSKPRSIRNAIIYLQVYTAIILVMVLATYFDNIFFTILAILFIAGRQHSLYILNHDASHYGLFHSKRTNKIIGSILSNMMMFHHPEAWSYVQWRRIHLLHHKKLFTEGDLNYVGRVNAGHVKSNLSFSSILWICIKTGLFSFPKLFTFNQDVVSPDLKTTSKSSLNQIRALLFRFKGDPEMEEERKLKLLFFLVSFLVISYFSLWWHFLVLWILPMYTFYPMILMFMDLTEHRWHEDVNNLYHNTRSIKHGFISKLFLSFLPRGYHLEHHIYPSVVAADLGKLNRVLCSQKLITTLHGIPELIKDITTYTSENHSLQAARKT